MSRYRSALLGLAAVLCLGAVLVGLAISFATVLGETFYNVSTGENSRLYGQVIFAKTVVAPAFGVLGALALLKSWPGATALAVLGVIALPLASFAAPSIGRSSAVWIAVLLVPTAILAATLLHDWGRAS